MEEKKNSKLGLGILIGLIIAAVVGLGTYIVFDKVINKDEKKENNTVEPTPSDIPVKKEVLTKFDKNYVLTAKDKEDIAKVISSSKSFGNGKIDVDSIKILDREENHDHVLVIEFKETTSGDSLLAWIYKVNGEIKGKFVGSGWAADENGTDLEKFEKELVQQYAVEPTTSPVPAENKELDLSKGIDVGNYQYTDSKKAVTSEYGFTVTIGKSRKEINVSIEPTEMLLGYFSKLEAGKVYNYSLTFDKPLKAVYLGNMGQDIHQETIVGLFEDGTIVSVPLFDRSKFDIYVTADSITSTIIDNVSGIVDVYNAACYIPNNGSGWMTVLLAKADGSFYDLNLLLKK